MDYSVAIQDPYTSQRVSEVYQRFSWLQEVVGMRNYEITKETAPDGKSVTHTFHFKDKQHALLFKLTWGGK